jgi:FMN-dependent NADH-azoreductase
MKQTLLQLNSSLQSENGQSTRLANAFVAGWKARNPEGTTIVRDLNRDPVPHLTAERLQAFITRPEQRTPEQLAGAAYSDALIDELKRADVIVVGLPMYNFDIPSTLKAYFDHVARAGVTFRYSERGSVGLLPGKKAYVFATRGGIHAGTPSDTQTGHVRNFLGLLGITDVDFIYAEGLAISDTTREAALGQARQAIERLNATQREALAA